MNPKIFVVWFAFEVSGMSEYKTGEVVTKNIVNQMKMIIFITMTAFLSS